MWTPPDGKGFFCRSEGSGGSRSDVRPDGAVRPSFGAIARTLLIGLIAFLTLVDLLATQAILPLLRQAYGVTPAAMGLAVNASTTGIAVATLAVAFFSQKIDRRWGIILSLTLLAIPTLCLAFAPNLAVFATLRILQGLCMVTPRRPSFRRAIGRTTYLMAASYRSAT
jgi:MFS family permease